MHSDACYYCGAPKTSMEHIPPKCIFPKESNFRKDLITVPSCEKHNQEKSGEDVYLRDILSFSVTNNSYGQDMAITRSATSVERHKYFEKSYLTDPKNVIIIDSVTGKEELGGSIVVDTDRINAVFEHMARGLYYKHYKDQWSGAVECVQEFLLSDDIQTNDARERITKHIDEFFFPSKQHGENKEIFYYQFVQPDEKDESIIYMRFTFYGGTKVYLTLIKTKG